MHRFLIKHTNLNIKKMKRLPFYTIKIVQQDRPFSYYAGPTEIILGPFMMYRKEVIDYCKHLQKCMGKQVKVEFKRMKITIKK